jgi:hypothetical protein
MAIFNSYVSLAEGIWELHGSLALAFTVRSVSVGGVPRVTLALPDFELDLLFVDSWLLQLSLEVELPTWHISRALADDG